MIYKLSGKSRICTIIICIIFVCSTPIISAAETVKTGNEATFSGLVLTIEDAQKRAIANSNNLKMADYSIEQSRESLDAAADEVKYIPSTGDSSEASSAFISYAQSSISLETSKKEKDIKEDAIIKDVFQKYTDVLTAQEKIKSAEKNLAYAAFQRLAARVGYQAKTVSLSDKNAAERNYTSKEIALNENRINLNTSYQKLNTLLGLDAKARPVLQDDPQFSVLVIDDLENEVTHRLSANPEIWQAEKAIEQAQLAVDLYSYSISNIQNYRVKKLNVNKSELSAAETKEQARQTIRNLYNSIYNLEQRYQSTLQDLEAAEEALNTAKLKYEMGTVSKGEVLKAEADLANLQQTLKSTAYEHELLEISFDKPWVN